jgi:ornithine cyclodeaminase/alanine dehydrogenase-like protein (mu-crystallin family)
MSKRHRTLVLSRADVAALLRMDELVVAVRSAYITHQLRPAAPPQKVAAELAEGSTTIVFPGVLDGTDCYTVKVNAKFPGNLAAGLPFLVGTILLLDRSTGLPHAILESSLITAMRTAAAGVIGVETLARADARSVALIGAGAQGEWQIRALHQARRIERAAIYDLAPDRAIELAARLGAELHTAISVAPSAAEAIAGADVLITVTQSRTSIVTPDLVHPGLHINAFGADEPGKMELHPNVVRHALMVVDDCQLALTAGALNVPHANGVLDQSHIHAEIGEVLLGRQPGRTSNEQVTIFGNVGLAMQDLVAAHLVYDRALAERMGTWVELL